MDARVGVGLLSAGPTGRLVRERRVSYDAFSRAGVRRVAFAQLGLRDSLPSRNSARARAPERLPSDADICRGNFAGGRPATGAVPPRTREFPATAVLGH